MGNTALNRSGVLLLTNKSGGAVAQGDVVIIDTSTASSFTTTTTTGYVNTMIGVVIEPNGIANNASGLVVFSGYAPKVNLDASASLGNLIKTDTVAKQGTPHAAPLVAGDFGIVLSTGTAPEALLWGYPEQAGSGSASGPTSDFFAYLGTNQNITSGGTPIVNMDTEVRDTGSDYDAVTNFRWTPPAGIVDIYAKVAIGTVADGDAIGVRLLKNGGLIARRIVEVGGADIGNQDIDLHYRDEANGTDYYEITGYAQFTSGTRAMQAGSTLTYWFGTLLKW